MNEIAIGTVKGFWNSSPGNPYPWQAAFKTSNGWAYYFSKISGRDAILQAKKASKNYLQTLDNSTDKTGN